jgi:hypothetical protein
MDPAKKRTPDKNTGIQNDLPVPRCLIAFKVLKPSIPRRVATNANITAEIRINQFTVHSNHSSFYSFVLRFKIYNSEPEI